MKKILVFLCLVLCCVFTVGCSKNTKEIEGNYIDYGLYVFEDREYQVREILLFSLSESDEHYVNIDSINSSITIAMNEVLENMKSNFYSHFIANSYTLEELNNFLAENIAIEQAKTNENNSVSCVITYRTTESFSVFHCKQDVLKKEEQQSSTTSSNIYDKKFLWTRSITRIQFGFSSLNYNLAKLFNEKFSALNNTLNISQMNYVFEYGLQDNRCYSDADNVISYKGLKIHQWVKSQDNLNSQVELYYIVFNQYIWYILSLLVSFLVVGIILIKNRNVYKKAKNLKVKN